MIIEKIDSKQIMIILSGEDLKKLELTPQNTIKNVEFFSKKEKSKSNIIMDFLPQTDGCIIMAHINMAPKKRTIYKIKQKRKEIIFGFNDIEDLLSAINVIPYYNNILSTLIEFGGIYYLILPCTKSIFKNYIIFLKEYANISVHGFLKTALLKEHGTVIIENNAIKILSEKFLK